MGAAGGALGAYIPGDVLSSIIIGGGASGLGDIVGQAIAASSKGEEFCLNTNRTGARRYFWGRWECELGYGAGEAGWRWLLRRSRPTGVWRRRLTFLRRRWVGLSRREDCFNSHCQLAVDE